MVLQLLLACVVWFAAIGAAFPKSVTGKHCPTAPVQLVVRSEAKVDCCGKSNLKPQIEVSAPKPGEDHFQQCLCADKRSKAVEIGYEFGAASLPAILGEFPRIALPLQAVSRDVPSPLNPAIASGVGQPKVPPPNAF